MDTRVYVLAKELGLSSKELLAFFSDAGVEASSHMSMLSPQACDLARKKFVKKESTASKEKSLVESKKTTAKKADVVSVKKTEQKEKREAVREQAVDSDAGLSKGSPETEVTPNQKVNKLDNMQQIPSHKQVHSTPQDLAKKNVFFEEEEELPFKALGGKDNDEPSLEEVVEKAAAEPGKMLGLKGEEKFARRFGVIKQQRSSRKRRRRVQAQAQQEVVEAVSEIVIDKERPLFEVAQLMKKQSSELIGALLRKGKVCSINQMLSTDVIKELAQSFGLAFSEVKPQHQGLVGKKDLLVDGGETRWPVVVIMGHVDHGKTSLLDYILKTNVAAREKGGITQHISVYQVNSSHGKVVFLDTPGHEAFSYLRKRGARVTDIVVLVVAADDGVMPQTVEAIKHAQEAQVPIIVAINKIDKPNIASGIDTIKRQLAQHNLMPEDWGGDVICVPLSAKTGQGVDELLDMISLQAQMMELKGHASQSGKAFIVESRLDKGYGLVANAICTEGTINVGDYFVSGENLGKVRLLLDPFGNRLTLAGPSTPVNIVGFNNSSAMGDWLSVVSAEQYSRARSGKGDEKSAAFGFMQQQDPFALVKNQITLVLKADTRGSLEAITHSIEKLSKEKKDIGCSIVIAHSGIGDITENDIDFTKNIGAQILGFSVKAEKNALSLAKERGVDLEVFSIIYLLIENLDKALEAKKIIKKTWKKTGEAVVRKVFDIKGIGIIAGCYLREGVCSRTNKVVCMRNGKKIGEGKITSLQRDRKSVKEVHAGFEFGFSSDVFHEWLEDDIVQCFSEVEAVD